jgi:chromosome segregation ATPase
METNISVVKNDFKVFKKQIQQLREQLKNTQTKKEKLAIHQKMLELIQTYETKYPILFGRYIHTDFHVTEQELKEELKKEIEKLRENLQAQLS